MKISTKLTNYLKNLRSTKASPSSGIPQGVQAEASFSSSRIKVPGLLTSFGRHRSAAHKSRHLILPETAHASGFSSASTSAPILAPIFALTLAVFGISLFSQTAYAASYINVSSGSGGTVSLGSIKPSATGVSASGSDTLTITTNCSAGYSVYVSAQNGGDTNLTNTNSSVTTNNTISASSTAVGSTATALSSNTWGITGDSASASANKYVGLPAYANATDAALITVPSADTSGNNTNTIYYGVKVDTSLSPGTYAGDVLYTVLMNNACLEYTLKFDDNGATTSNLPDQTISFGQAVDLSEYSTTDKISKTGYHLLGWKIKNGDGTLLPTNNNTSLDDGESSELTLIAQWEANTYAIKYAAGSTGGSCSVSDTAATYDQNVTLSSTKCTKTNYDQTGWSINQDGSTKDYTLGQTLAKPNLITENNGSFPLYPYFESTVAYMQDWTGCSALSTNQYLTLRDSRDDNDYVVKKLADGKCWMVQNLRLTNYKLTSADSDVSAEFDLTKDIAYSSSSGWCMTDDATCDDVKAVYYDSSEASNSSKSSYYGALYNWYTATAGTGTYSLSSGNATSSICPKGWRLPNGGAYGEFVALDKVWGGTGENRTNANTNSIFRGDYSSSSSGGFGLAGEIKGSVSGVKAYGNYWSSTANSSSEVYILTVGSTNKYVGPYYYVGKYYGQAMRCIADETMQGVKISDLSESATTTLVDSRDEQKYTVYRWPSSGTAGTSYPTGMAGYAIMTQDLSLGYVTGGSITAGSNLSLTTAASNFDSNTAETTGSSKETVTYDSTETVTARTGTSDWSTTNSYTNKQYINGTGGTYDNHTYYSWGAAMVVCPKGWRLTTNAENLNIRDFMGGNNSTGSSKIRGTPYNFVDGGYFASSGWSSVGSLGHYWSSTQNSSTYGRYLYFNSGDLNADNRYKYYGRSVRCVATP